MKKFFKKTEGFTLVELIVVIAILGILAGVGTVGYSGYIKKANMAADQTLLATLNQAFNAACIENGITQKDITTNGAKAVMENKAVKSVTEVAHAKGDKIEESFDKYYAGNTDNVFKTISSASELFYNPEYGFYIPALLTDVISVGYGGGTIYLTPADVQALAASGFISYAGLGVENLLDKVNEVTLFAAEFSGAGSTLMQNVYKNPDFQSYLMTAMGADATTIRTKMESLAEDMVESGKCSSISEAQQQIQANCAVLYAAKNATMMSQDGIVALLAGENTAGNIIKKMTTGGGEGTAEAFSQAAIAYGMYTAYAHSIGEGSSMGTPADVLLKMDSDAGFKAYMQKEEAKKDLQGYLSALNMINSSSGDPTAVSSLLVNGFADDDLAGVLNQAIGNN